MKLLVLFLDGFHPDYARHPNAHAIRDLADTSAAAGVEPVLGFSNANKVSLFTGETPAAHDEWCYFRYDPENSPFKGWDTRAFKWIDHVPGELARKGLKFTLSKTFVRRRGRGKGYPKLSWENVPVSLLPHFDHSERDALNDPDVPSLFTIARDAGLRTAWVDVPWIPRKRHLKRVEAAIRENDVVVVYNAAMDAAGHWFAPEPSPRFDAWLARTDRLVRFSRRAARYHWGRDHHTSLVSDHGMAATKRHVDALKLLKDVPGMGARYVPFIDATMARFWFDGDSARRRVESLFEGLGHGRFLTAEDARELGVDFAHRGYGDAIYLLEPDTAFYPAYVSWVRPRGMHGYDPRHASQTAVFTSTADKTLPARLPATDVLRHLTSALDLRAPASAGGDVHEAIHGGMRDGCA